MDHGKSQEIWPRINTDDEDRKGKIRYTERRCRGIGQKSHAETRRNIGLGWFEG